VVAACGTSARVPEAAPGLARLLALGAVAGTSSSTTLAGFSLATAEDRVVSLTLSGGPDANPDLGLCGRRSVPAASCIAPSAKACTLVPGPCKFGLGGKPRFWRRSRSMSSNRRAASSPDSLATLPAALSPGAAACVANTSADVPRATSGAGAGCVDGEGRSVLGGSGFTCAGASKRCASAVGGAFAAMDICKAMASSSSSLISLPDAGDRPAPHSSSLASRRALVASGRAAFSSTSCFAAAFSARSFSLSALNFSIATLSARIFSARSFSAAAFSARHFSARCLSAAALSARSLSAAASAAAFWAAWARHFSARSLSSAAFSACHFSMRSFSSMLGGAGDC